VEDRPWRLGEFQAISTHATVAEIFQLKSTKSKMHAGGSSLRKRQRETEPCCSCGKKTKQSHCARTEHGRVAFNTLCLCNSCVIVADKSAIGHNNCVQDLECRNCHGDFSGRCVQDFILIVRLSVVVPKSFF